jgi:hypothetical protein
MGPLDVFLPPMIIDGLSPAMNSVPAVGEHTDSILWELGLHPSRLRIA